MTKLIEFTICNCGNPEGHSGPVWHPGQPIPEGAKITEKDLLKVLSGSALMKPKIVEIGAQVIRCGCGDPDSHNGSRGSAYPCPSPRIVKDLGPVAKQFRNPLSQLEWNLVGKRKADKRIQEANRLN